MTRACRTRCAPSQVLSGATLVGRDVLASDERQRCIAGGTVKGAVDIPRAVSDAQLDISTTAPASSCAG